MMISIDRPRITRCKLCLFWIWSDYYGAGWCTRVNTQMDAHDGCTRGADG